MPTSKLNATTRIISLGGNKQRCRETNAYRINCSVGLQEHVSFALADTYHLQQLMSQNPNIQNLGTGDR
ncbi:hypothetical protein MEO39_27430, partial [Dolichospermum sp. ST_sed2]|nr:hypothetical protein [Dolichospermum sp. ST_sed2]